MSKEIEETQKRFYRMSKVNQVETLFSALDFMQSYNGRSKWECIDLAMNE